MEEAGILSPTPLPFLTFWHIYHVYEKLFFFSFHLYKCLHCDEVCICWHFGDPGAPGFDVRAQHDPEFCFHIFYFNSMILVRLLPYLTCKLI